MKPHAHLPCAMLLATACLCAALPAAAQQTFRVDDSASQVLGSTLRLEPATMPARGRPMTTVSGDIAVQVRLDVSPWLGRSGRIYMRLPEQAAGTVTATWTTRGRLLAGVLRAGERALVHAGPITANTTPGGLLEDTLRLHVEADGRRLRPSEQLAFTFEIDLDLP